MTVTEAEAGAAARHEFRAFDYAAVGRTEVVRFVCWCSDRISANYLSEQQARNAHERHRLLCTKGGWRG